MTRRQLHDLVRESTKRLFDEKLIDLEDKLVTITKCPPEKIDVLQDTIKNFKTVYKRKWLSCNSTESRFLEKNQEWLNEEISFPVASVASSSKGRPNKEFGELSDRSKRRNTLELRMNVPLDKLTYATQMSQRAAGNIDAAKIIKDVTKSATSAAKFRKLAVLGSQKTTTKKHSPEEALAVLVEAYLTMSQYEVIRQANKDVYPCYKYVQNAKQDCYPPKNNGETFAKVKLQDLVDHTTWRLCRYLEPVLENIQSENKEFVLIFKWGCDGSKQCEYKQKFEDESDSDANIFLSSLVPVRLLCGKQNIWQNPNPSSPRFCRPIRMRFVKENKDITNEEIEYVEKQARNLQATKLKENIEIRHKLLPTMVDGKVCNAATNTTSTMRCYICGKTSKNFNDLTKESPEKHETLQFGLSILHARIRFFEYLLHLSYKVKAGVRESRVTIKTDKEKIQTAKQNMQKEFRQKMGLLVDIPKAGYGNTNDGNTSRRFFNNVEEAAAITGIDFELINRFKIILEVLSSGFKIDVEKFSMYTMDTAKLYVNLYPWQPMSPTIHTILTHSASVIAHALLPIGQLSEEAAEARNKHFRQYRESFSQKFSRKECNEDVLNRLLLTSDPYLSSIKPKTSRKKQSFTKEALELLQPEPDLDSSDESDTE
ncbi:unnamed protein product [Ceutorhynchus assimilis]|uniref:Uncharacterized protein n=1 Tax=Ceutorhynchus assimilis TaxID=467358 RepID=A0A9N9QIS2_9CUCU|nr:unnamed protein product [Ceutorhynchus assimilis]